MQLCRGGLFFLLAHQLSVAAAAGRGAVRSPVEKVVNLLKDLQDRIGKDGAKEQMIYDKYACWCEKTTARKAKAIEDAKTDLRSLGQEILIQRGRVGSLTAQIQQTTQDIKTNEEAQQEATAIRQKENAAFMAETAELKQAIAALEKAIIVLRDAAGSASASALLQKRFRSSEHSLAVEGRAMVAVARLQEVVAALPTSSLAKLNKHGAAVSRLALLRSYATELAKSGGKAKYTPQSATITGILDEMYGTFTEDLQSMMNEEADKNSNFEALIATKQEELLLLQETLKKAEKDKAEANLMLAEAAQAYDDTEAQMKADIGFFDATKDACQAKTTEWSTRKQIREEELAGIAKALEILTSDEARQLFSKAIKDGKATPGKAAASFLQVGGESSEAGAPAKKAYEALKKQAKRAHSLRLARLAAAVKMSAVGHFGEVLKAIDDLIQELKGEQASDIAKRDQCKEEYQKINSTMADLAWKIEVNEAKINKLTNLIDKLKDDKEQTILDIEDVKQEIVDMNSTRKEENDAFLQAKKDDEDAIQLLTQAKDVLAEFYSNHSIELGPIQGGEGVGLLQQGPEFERSADDAPDATFSDKGHRKGEGKGIVSILTMLIEELGDEITVAQKEEEASQLSYEKQLKAAQDLQEQLETKKVNLEEAISNREQDKLDEEADKTKNGNDLQAEKDYLTEIKPDCDFAINKFAGRMTARTAELDGLREAKEFLVGYHESAAAQGGGSALLQASSPTFDSSAAVITGLRRRAISHHDLV